MSNIIPPMVSSSPPPMDDNLDDDEDDEFGDFASANLSYDIGDIIQPSNPSARKVSWGSEATSSDLRLKEGEVEMVKQNGTCGRDSDPGTTDEDEEEVECQVFAKTDAEKGDNIQVPELQQDNTSQDSVVSGATDSGLCSASQNSEGTSPLPHGDDVDRLSPIGLEVPCDMSREESSESDKTLVRSVEENRRTFHGECILAAREIPVSICDPNETQDKMRNVEENCVAGIEDLHSKSSDFDVSESEQFNRLSSTDARDQNQQESSEARMVDGENDGFGDFSEFQTVSEVNVLQSESNVLNELSDRLFEDRADGEGFSDFHSSEFSKHLDNSESTDSDDFGGFEGVPTMEAAVRGEGATTQCKVMLDSECVDDDDDFNDEFADFTSAAAPIESGSLFPESQLPESATECSSWADVQTTASLDQIDDDFDDFETADFNTETSSCETDHNKLLSRLQSVVSTLFPSPAEAGSEEASSSNVSLRALGECLDSSSPVWGKLRDIETSHALSYQWSGSAANKILLTALGIDSRNINPVE